MALTDQDKREIEKITRKEIKDFMDTTQAHKIVVKIIKIIEFLSIIIRNM